MQDVKEPQKLIKGSFLSEFVLGKYLFRPGVYTITVEGNGRDKKAWISGKDIESFTIAEEYCQQFKRENQGIINIPDCGKRRYI